MKKKPLLQLSPEARAVIHNTNHGSYTERFLAGKTRRSNTITKVIKLKNNYGCGMLAGSSQNVMTAAFLKLAKLNLVCVGILNSNRWGNGGIRLIRSKYILRKKL